MKKLLYLLLLLPLGLLGACSSDDDLPDVDLTVEFENIVSADNQLYVVQGEPIEVKGVYAKGNDNKAAAVNDVVYALDGFPVATSIFAPYAAKIGTASLQPGAYNLSLRMNILQVDKSLAFGIINFPVVVVKDATDLPEGKEPGAYSTTVRVSPKK